jgi:hypothetical protein
LCPGKSGTCSVISSCFTAGLFATRENPPAADVRLFGTAITGAVSAATPVAVLAAVLIAILAAWHLILSQRI